MSALTPSGPPHTWDTTQIAFQVRGGSISAEDVVRDHLAQIEAHPDLNAFVTVDGGSLAETLLESELFGHERGSFTGAIAMKKGLLEKAHLGTCFLDEVADLSPALQGKLLRVIQEREIRRVGSTSSMTIDVRIIAATNVDLRQMMEEGKFREDLFYRLHVISIQLPPLRDRKEDILPLAMHFIRKFSQELKKKLDGVNPEAAKMLTRYNWPGNIRELENAIERAALLAEAHQILPDDLRLGDSVQTPGVKDNQSVVRIPPSGIALEQIERSGEQRPARHGKGQGAVPRRADRSRNPAHAPASADCGLPTADRPSRSSSAWATCRRSRCSAKPAAGSGRPKRPMSSS